MTAGLGLVFMLLYSAMLGTFRQKLLIVRAVRWLLVPRCQPTVVKGVFSCET
ncbi:hypothetical protein [Azospirillum endophyticum]